MPLVDIGKLTALELDVDGADEIDHQKRMIKGGGGALIREKIVANMSKEMIVIVDQDKLVDHLVKFPLPIEIFPFAWSVTVDKINQLDFQGKIRTNAKKERYI